MRYLPLPSSMVTIVAVATLGLVAWLAWASLRHPEGLWAPGDLSRYHADIKTCTSCHAPFRGATAAQCAACHTPKQFAAKSEPAVREFHHDVLRKGESCRGCHTEHRGALGQITTGALINPHGEFVFRVTGAKSCTACHTGIGKQLTLLDNVAVRHLIEEGEGAHKPGKFANCLSCHVGGRLEIDDEDEREH